jgi:hypothetical protein
MMAGVKMVDDSVKRRGGLLDEDLEALGTGGIGVLHTRDTLHTSIHHIIEQSDSQ